LRTLTMQVSGATAGASEAESELEAALAVADGLAAADVSARRFRPFEGSQRYRAFRRFVLGFQHEGVRDPFLRRTANPPNVRRPRHGICRLLMTHACESHLGRHFFQLVRLRRWVRFSPRLAARGPDVHESTTAAP